MWCARSLCCWCVCWVMLTCGLLASLVTGCGRVEAGEEARSGAMERVVLATGATALASSDEGHFTLVTYNIAGLPHAISPSRPEDNIPQMGPRLSAYDVVLVQEDFVYHDRLTAAVAHEFRTPPQVCGEGEVRLRDGLSLLSHFAVVPDSLVREEWAACHGRFSHAWDCQARKGFAVSQVELAPGVVLTLINLHMDAGRADGDKAARAAQVEQLVAWIEANVASDEALIVAGDTNLVSTDADDARILASLLEGAGLTDTCAVAHGGPAEACEGAARLDKVLYRSGGDLELEVVGWREAAQEFVDASGEPLSDHAPLVVDLGWSMPRLARR